MVMLFVPFIRKNCIHHAYIDDVSLPSEIYSWYLHPSEIGILDNNPLRKTSLLVLTPSENLIYLEGVEIKWKGPVLALKRKSKSAYTSFISDTVPYWWRGCSLVLQCFVENCREGEIYVVVGKVSWLEWVLMWVLNVTFSLSWNIHHQLFCSQMS